MGQTMERQLRIQNHRLQYICLQILKVKILVSVYYSHVSVHEHVQLQQGEIYSNMMVSKQVKQTT
jgi:hypothetical protein